MAGFLSAISMKPIIHVQKSKINHRYYFNNNDSFYSIFYRLCIWLKPVSMFFKKAQKLQPPVYKGKAKKLRSSSLLFTREKQKRAEASAAHCAVDVSAPGGSCFQEYIDAHCVLFALSVLSHCHYLLPPNVFSFFRFMARNIPCP